MSRDEDNPFKNNWEFAQKILGHLIPILAALITIKIIELAIDFLFGMTLESLEVKSRPIYWVIVLSKWFVLIGFLIHSVSDIYNQIKKK